MRLVARQCTLQIGKIEPFLERFEVFKNTREDEVEKRPELSEVVLRSHGESNFDNKLKSILHVRASQSKSFSQRLNTSLFPSLTCSLGSSIDGLHQRRYTPNHNVGGVHGRG